MREISIGIAGTAKNTGKTTALSALLSQLKLRQDTVGLTGIGYDGESFDNVTGLPKPRIHVYEGMVVAVAERCFKFSRAKVERLIRTDILTSLGRIIVGRVTEPGKLVLAGPTKSSELRKTLEHMKACGAKLTIVDGALGRIAPFTEVDGVILATGAARESDIDKLARESQCMFRLLRYPVLQEKGNTVHFGSILSEKSFENLLKTAQDAETVAIDGLMSGQFFERLAEAGSLKGKRILFSDSLKLIIAGDMQSVCGALDRAESFLEIGVKKPVSLVSVTINPYYPMYRYKTGDYEAAYVDKDSLLRSISESAKIKCHDVVAQGGEGLLKDVAGFWQSFSDRC